MNYPIIFPATTPKVEEPHPDFPNWCAARICEAFMLDPRGYQPADDEFALTLKINANHPPVPFDLGPLLDEIDLTPPPAPTVVKFPRPVPQPNYAALGIDDPEGHN